MGDNPFAAFFYKSEAPTTATTATTAIISKSQSLEKPQPSTTPLPSTFTPNQHSKSSSPSPTKKRPRTPSVEKKELNNNQFKKPRPISNTTTATKLSQLHLINAYRLTHPASVDAFHTFLVSLPSNDLGHYWALIASLLSVQCRDVVALQMIHKLMNACPKGIEDVALLNAEQLLPLIRSCNFCNTKVKNIIATTEQIQTLFHGSVPTSYKQLLKFKGVGPKIANLMCSVSFGKETGIVVDTHVHKISAALAWTIKAKHPEDSRMQLERWVPMNEWTHFTLSVVGFGQTVQRKDWKKKFLTFSKEQGAMEIGMDIMHRLMLSGCKIGDSGDGGGVISGVNNGESGSSSSSSSSSTWTMQGTVLPLDCPWDNSKRTKTNVFQQSFNKKVSSTEGNNNASATIDLT